MRLYVRSYILGTCNPKEMLIDNRMGKNLPPQADRDEALAYLQKARAILTKFCIVLSPEVRKSLLRIRKNAREHQQLVPKLVTTYKMELPGMAVSELVADQKVDAALVPLQIESDAIGHLIDDSRDASEHEQTQWFYAYYGMLKSAATRIPTLKAELAPVEEALAMPPSRKKP